MTRVRMTHADETCWWKMLMNNVNHPWDIVISTTFLLQFQRRRCHKFQRIHQFPGETLLHRFGLRQRDEGCIWEQWQGEDLRIAWWQHHHRWIWAFPLPRSPVPAKLRGQGGQRHSWHHLPIDYEVPWWCSAVRRLRITEMFRDFKIL